MNGYVDATGRAILNIEIRSIEIEPVHTLDVWIDTGFTGDLVVSKSVVANEGEQPLLGVSLLLGLELTIN